MKNQNILHIQPNYFLVLLQFIPIFRFIKFVTLVGFSNIVFATTDSVVITGTVQPVLSITIASGSPSFDITPGAAVTDQDIGTITINSNNPDGYDVTLVAANSAGLINSDADEAIAYTLRYNGGSAITVGTSTTNVENVTSATAGAVTRTLTLSISAIETAGKSAEAFSDTITMEILGK